MNYKIVCLSVLLALALAAASAETKTTFTGKCAKPDVQQGVPAGDQDGHVFMVTQGKCSITGNINGVIARQGNFSEEVEATPTSIKNRGVYVVTFDSGDKVYYKYQGSGTAKDGAFQSGTNKYEIAGGTGKMAGATGSGGCKLTGNSDGGVDYSCTGTYSVGPARIGTTKAPPRR